MSVTITDAQYAGSYHSNGHIRSRAVFSYSVASSTNTTVTLNVTVSLQVKTTATGKVGISYNLADPVVKFKIGSTVVDSIAAPSSWNSGQALPDVSVTATNTWTQVTSLSKSITVTKSTSTQSLVIYQFYMNFAGKEQATDGYSRLSNWNSSDVAFYTVPVKSYTIAYNANGGSGAPSSQTKTHGTSITLSTATPTRDGYSFAGWNTKSDGSGTSYAAGATFTSNANTTLYAKWTAIVSSLTIGTVKAIRVADSSSTTESDEGECAYVTVKYTAKGAAAATISLAATCKDDQDNSKTCTVSANQSKDANADKTGTFTVRASTLDIEKRYTFALTVSAAVTGQATKTASKSVVLPMAFFTMDVLAGGKGVAFGKPSTRSGLDIGMAAYTGKTLTFENAELDRDGANPQSTTYGTAYPRWVDNGGELVGLIRASRLTDGTQRLAIAAYNEVSGEDVNNGIILCVGADGSKSYTVGDPGAFCNAILATGYADGMDAKIASLSGATQIWRLMANCVNSNNADSRNGHQIGINVNNTDLSVYDYTSSASVYRLYSDQYTVNTDTVADICSAASNITINSASYRERAGMACFEVKFTPSAAISSATTVFTLASGKKPALTTNGCDSSTTYCCLVNTSGTVQCRRALTSGTSYTFRATYMLA